MLSDASPACFDGPHAAWNLAVYLRESAERWPEHEYLRQTGQSLSYAETWQRVRGISAWLQSQGIARGDRIVMVAENSIEVVLLFFATAQIGAISVILHPQIKAEGLRRILEQTEPRLVLLDATTASLQPVLGEIPVLWQADCADVDSSDPPAVPFPGIDQDPAFLVFTSGSTGTPRGVILTHDNVRFVSAAIQARLQYEEGDRVGVFLPLSFDYGLYQLFYAALTGASVFIGRPEMAGPELPRILAAQEITVLPGVPTLFGGLIKMQRYRPVPLPRLRVITNTGDHLPQTHLDSLRQLFPQARVFPMYGLTECKRVSILLPEEIDAHPGSVGRALDGTEVFAMDDAGRRLPPGQTGQLCVRGRHLALGYWRAPEETAQRYKVLGEGLCRVLMSGDQGSVDADGFLHFHGRSDFLIKHKGHRLSPAEVEEAACRLPHITMAGCVKDEARDQLCLFVQATAAEMTEKEVILALSEKLEPAKVPDRVTFLATIPLTGNQKVDRKALKALL
ncbi:MAG: class I adenylate-forming enzyme family protein [Prosthecobacter sp.]